MFEKILIANRGEIALRINRACHEMGIKTVAVHSTADADAMHVRLADEAVCIGSPLAKDSYLNKAAIISAALITGADAIHPGYGFLSENADFAEMVEEHGLTFIGPTPKMIRLMGDKITAKKSAIEAGLPVVPGSKGSVDTIEQALQTAHEIGYPIIIKASAGGGGKGMKIAFNDEELKEMYPIARREAKSNFANDIVYMEKYLQNPRHIEIQVLADTHGNVVHLGERDCSLQRHNQKVLEESLKEDPERDEKTLSAIKEKIRQEEEKEEDEQEMLPATPPHTFGGRWKHFTAAALSVAVVAVCLVVTLFSMEKPPEEHYYAAADYERVPVPSDYDFSALYSGNLVFTDYEIDRAYIYQTKDATPTTICIELDYRDILSQAFNLYIFLVENYEFESEGFFDLSDATLQMQFEVGGKTQTIKYKQSSTPNDASGGALETVSQMTKFKVDSFTYYMSVDSIRIVGEDTNQLAELIGQMF